MPRPKRARPAPPTRLAKTAAKPSNPSPEPEPQSNGASSDIYDVSPREKQRAAARRKSLRLSASTAALPESIQQQKSLDRTKQRRDAAMDRLANITSTDTDSAPQAGSSKDAEARVEATPLRRGRAMDFSGLDLDDSMFDDLDTTLDTAGPRSAQRSADTSVMSVSQFRRRPRAGSFLSRDDGPARPGSRGNTPGYGSTLNFGVFKRRKREPSILSTARKPMPQPRGTERERGRDDDDEEDDDEDVDDNEGEGQDEDGDVDMDDGFAPEAESTPLRRSKRVSGRVEPAEVPSSSGKSRKRKSTENHERRGRSSPYRMDEDVVESIEKPASDSESVLSSPPPLSPEHAPSTPVRSPVDPNLMAPPLSSSESEDDEELLPPLKSIPKTRTRQATVLRQTPGLDATSDISSPPSLTHSPNFAHSSSPPPRASKTKRKAPAAKPLPKLSTRDLTGLLPQRRRRRPNENDGDVFNMDDSEDEVDISGLGVGDDELSHMDVRTRRRPAARANAQAQSSSTAKSARASARSKEKPTQAPNKRISRTYGKISDKENQGNNEDEDEEDENESSEIVAEPGDEVEDSQMLVDRMGEELKNAVRKFEEVDKWELSFEERARSSSPLNAR